MQWTRHGGESKAHPRSSRGSILAAGAFTSHAPQPRLPHAATTRATSLGSFAHGCATNVASVLEHTQRENDPCTTQNDAHVSHKQVYVQRGRCAMHCSQLEPGPYTYRCSFHVARTCFAKRHAAAPLPLHTVVHCHASRTGLFCLAPCCRTPATSHRHPPPCIPHRTVLPRAMPPQPATPQRRQNHGSSQHTNHERKLLRHAR